MLPHQLFSCLLPVLLYSNTKLMGFRWMLFFVTHQFLITLIKLVYFLPLYLQKILLLNTCALLHFQVKSIKKHTCLTASVLFVFFLVVLRSNQLRTKEPMRISGRHEGVTSTEPNSSKKRVAVLHSDAAQQTPVLTFFSLLNEAQSRIKEELR